MTTTKKRPKKAAGSAPAQPPTNDPPANDPPQPADPGPIMPLFDWPERGVQVPIAALGADGFVEVYRYRLSATGDPVGVPAYTLRLGPTNNIDDIKTVRGGGTFLVRGKDATGRVVCSIQLAVDGPPIDPAKAGGAAGSRVDSVQSGAGFVLAIEGLTPAQQQMWLLHQQTAEDRRREVEEGRRADADRHSREMERQEKGAERTMNLLVTALTHRPGTDDNAVNDLRRMVKDAQRREDELRAKLDERTREAHELSTDLASTDGETTAKDIFVAIVENADTIMSGLSKLGIKVTASGTKKKIAAGGNGVEVKDAT